MVLCRHEIAPKVKSSFAPPHICSGIMKHLLAAVGHNIISPSFQVQKIKAPDPQEIFPGAFCIFTDLGVFGIQASP